MFPPGQPDGAQLWRPGPLSLVHTRGGELTWSEFQHVSSSWSNRCFFPNCRVLRFRTELTLEAPEPGRGEGLDPPLRAWPPPAAPPRHRLHRPRALSKESCTPSCGRDHCCPPPPPQASPAHRVRTNQRVGHCSSARPQASESGSARVRIPRRRSHNSETVHASELERPRLQHGTGTGTTHPSQP